ncbi:MAG: NADH-quinone oxidoreductase subunit A [Deltaproteobacteria bacterium]|nr:NADH-quinone oxidoreductase subunit A [Deltaproteobacteria bacterium]
MPQVNLFHDYLPVIVVMGITFVMAQAAVLVGMILKPRNSYDEKLGPWECGVDPVGEADAGKFTVQFYIIAVLFVIFDVETLFLFPWAVVLNKIGMFAFIEMVLFIAILLVGYFYAWRKGALEWVS